ncbi:hypothetical protein CSC94_23605 [Zhengella mangrovi]|uniref:Spore coat protein U/FanG domain-containing protein n=1 Tax=Zhengella mangrovi TaxID=1982044 RepID=A0A2G1QGK6_9HYPH|nr:spore coat U domain-containing protein [Zhengella mangrovi]PHP64584.1 hypothetical protein CSC94_23605 [Zhengella mangrovi]
MRIIFVLILHRITKLKTRIAFLLILYLIGTICAEAGANPPCPITMTNMSFGSSELSASSIDTVGNISVTCEAGGGPDQFVCISIESGSAGDAASRIMQNAGDIIRFELYKDASRTQKWGSWQSGYAGTGYQAILKRGVTYNIPVYGRIFGSQTASPGNFTSFFNTSPYLTNKDYNTSDLCPVNKNSSSSVFSVDFTVLASCSVSATNIDFGTTAIINGNIDTTSSINTQCSNGTPFAIFLDNGLTGTSPADRKMTNGADVVTYGLYQDSSRSTLWGNTIGSAVSGTGNGSFQEFTVYGRVPAQSTPPAGTYTDTVIVTVEY